MSRKVVIGIADCGKFFNYEKWILQDPGVEVIRLGHRQNNFDEIKKCDGILLTGGEDIHPRFYHRPEYLKYCDQEDMDEKRDELELRMMDYTQENKIPLLGICRGFQIANVFFGGTLIPDIPAFGKPDHSKVKGVDRYHDVSVLDHSLLRKISGAGQGEVNSAHHQGADRVGTGLKVSAVSGDGIVEGLERKDPEGKPFLLLVQWHPERMNDQKSAFTKNIRMAFLENVRTADKSLNR